MILGLFTQLMGAGGVERIGRHTAAVLASWAEAKGFPCRLLSLNDPPGYHEGVVGDLKFSFQGFARRKARFVLKVLALAPRVRLAYLAHPNLAPLGLALRLLRPGARYWVATYGIDVWKPLPWIWKQGLHRATGVTALSRFTRDRVVGLQGVIPDKVWVLPPALDPEFSAVKDFSGRASSLPPGRVLLTVARLAASERYKGVETVIRTLPKVLARVPDARYVIVGDGDDRPRLEGVANETGVNGQVLFVGARFGKELADYYRACDLFVMPSRGEGFGVVFLEAMMFGKPVIGGNHGGTPDVVVDGVTGFLVEHGDVEGLADKIVRLLQDEDLRKQMGEAGRRRVDEHFTFERFKERLIHLLEGEEQ